MDDAYEIGIRLVLENGVSSGIAALQRDLVAYDRALAATGGRLRTMTEAGRRLAAPAGRAGPAVHALFRGEQTPAPDAAGGQRPVAAVPAPAVPMPSARQPPPTAVPVPVKPSQPGAGAAPVMAGAAVAGRTAAAPERASRLPAIPEPPVSAAPPPRDATPPGRCPAAAAVTVMAVPPPYARYAPASPAGPPPAVAAPDVPNGSQVSMPVADQQRGQQAPLALRDVVRTTFWDVPTPGAPPALAGPQVAPRQGSGSAAAAPASPVAAASSSGPTQGDVYLDGARVGRWMSDRLAREVNRPQAGVTGFDPRLGPAWPGSLHGT